MQLEQNTTHKILILKQTKLHNEKTATFSPLLTKTHNNFSFIIYINWKNNIIKFENTS